MKRKHIREYKSGIFSCFPLFFWQYCCMCRKDFRREKGFRFLSGPYWGSRGIWRYLCSTCAPTKGHAHEIALNNKYWSKRPPPPPRPRPPPPNQIKNLEN